MTAPMPSDGGHSLWVLQRQLLERTTFTDLTRAFHPGQPHFPAFHVGVLVTLLSPAAIGSEGTAGT